MLDLTRLTAEQRRVVLAPDGPVAVVAGPGSGKTTVLAARVAYLVAGRGVDPASVLALTFTAAAARALRARLVAVLGDPGGRAGDWVVRRADRRAGAGHRAADGREPRSKKGCAAGALPVGARHALVRELSGVASARDLCRILGVNRSWFYRAGAGAPAAAE